MIEESVRAHLIADAGVAALVVARVFPMKLPQVVTFPAITYQRIARGGEGTFSTPAKLPDVLLQVDSWATTYTAVKALAAAVQLALDNFRGTVGAHTIQAVILENDTDFFDPDLPELYRVEAEYRVWFNA